MSIEALFKPVTVGNLDLPNRIVLAPMTRNFSPNGVPGEDVAAYYKRRAQNGVGLIITEGTAINHPAAVSSPNIPNFHGEKSLEGWAKVVNEVHAVGGKIIPQLWHVGTARPVGAEPNPEANPVGPSGLTGSGERVSEPLTESEIADLIAAYAQAAVDAKRLGFDGIELHGAHGYLIDQFFWGRTNKRTDRYGGDLTERTRFAVEIIEAVRKATGSDFPIVLRFSQWKGQEYGAKLVDTPQQLASFLEPLSNAGVDIFHASTRRFWVPEFEGSDLNLAGWTKKLTGKPSITVGSVGLNSEFLGGAAPQLDGGKDLTYIQQLIDRLENQEFDLIAVGRALLVDPEWVTKLKDNRIDEIIPYTTEARGTLF